MSNRAERRREAKLDRLIKRRIETDGDNCSLCRRRFVDHDTTFYGTAFGSVVVTGRCCSTKLNSMLGAGVYVARDSSRTYMQARKLEEDAS